MGATAKIGRFVAETSYDNVPTKALKTAKTAVLDSIGVALAGSTEEAGKLCAWIAREEDATKEATVLGQGFKSSALQAAFANGTAVHAMDYDYSFIILGQPMAPIVPAAFSLAESLGAGGRQVLEAYVAAFEVVASLALSLDDSPQDGWHANGTLGTFGATVACARLLGLEATKVEIAIGIAAAMASGLVCNFGTMSKPLDVGLAARNGVMAAKLAQAGFTANSQAIEADLGFFDTYYRLSPAKDSPIESLGDSYELEKNNIKIKPYPCGGLAHTSIDAMLDIRAKHGVTAEVVQSVEVNVTSFTASRIIFGIPETDLQAKFSMPYLMARAIIDGKVSVSSFTDSAVHAEDVLKLAEKVHMRVDPALKEKDGGRPSKVTVHTKDGQTYTQYVEFPRGSRQVPLNPDELRAKFMECAQLSINETSASRALEYLDGLETLEDIRLLGRLLIG